MMTIQSGPVTRKVAIPMTLADLDMVRDRLSPSTQQELQRTATESTPGNYVVQMTETRALDLASKAANLGLVVIANRIRQALDVVAV